ncbi:MAG: hypothetical protein WBV45_00615 [Lutimonas sp.]
MESARIEKLLEKYYEAETTLTEEKELKEYFSKSDVPVHLAEHKQMFNYFNDSSLETSNRSIKLSNKTIALRWLSVAAMLVFFVSIFGLYQQNEAEKEEARMAYQETQKALELISKSLNKGSGAIAQLENFNKGTDAMAELQAFENTQSKVFVVE